MNTHYASLANVGSVRLLAAVCGFIGERAEDEQAVRNFEKRLTVHMDDDAWPKDAEGKRLPVQPYSVMNGEVPGATLKLDGTEISNTKALELYQEAFAKETETKKLLNGSPFEHKGRSYIAPLQLKMDLEKGLRASGIDPEDALKRFGRL